ncbi:hypothetical protein SNE40_016886 [Patella caerulea]|uniref:Transgelin n=2 Tax=Patella caerulea TaxID=87958 RepID=A0AAN8JE34_PATCE
MAIIAAPKGMDRALITKMGAKYDTNAEAEVKQWLKELLDVDIGSGTFEVEKSLRNGKILMELIIKIYEGTPNKPPKCDNLKLKVNQPTSHFKQMENIELFLKACNAYGVKQSSLFLTSDLFEGRNMAMVLATILQLGTEAQRHGFNGPTCGSKPTEKHVTNFSEEQLRAGECIIGLQAGTNKLASQKGMSIGSVRHVADIKVDDQCSEGQGVIGLQSGTNKFASQKGMSFGAVRHIADIRADDACSEGQGVIGLQSGTNKCASQAGMVMGAVRHVSDIRCDNAIQDGQGVIGLQSGTNKFASQSGMSFGAVRHIADIRADDQAQDGQGIIGLQSGSNKFASQKGMSFGAVRHVSDIRADDATQDGQGIISLQSGTNQFASQKGMMGMGAMRHISDIKVEDMLPDSKSAINLQYGNPSGANQAGMTFGSRRDIMRPKRPEAAPEEES